MLRHSIFVGIQRERVITYIYKVSQVTRDIPDVINYDGPVIIIIMEQQVLRR